MAAGELGGDAAGRAGWRRVTTEEVKADKVLATFSHEGFRFAGTVGNLVVFERPRPLRAAPRPAAPKPVERPAPESID